MSSSSLSDSDSDNEPNSHGARVFWGNVKTPERFGSNFVNPPKTVVKSNKLLHSRRSVELSSSTQDDATARRNQQGAAGDEDRTPNLTRLYDLDTRAEENAMDVDIELEDPRQLSIDVLDHSNGSPESVPPTASPPLQTCSKTQPSDTSSESEVEDPVLHFSLLVDSCLVLLDDSAHIGVHNLQNDQVIARSRSVSPISTPSKLALPRASQLPDLISFDIPTPTQSSPALPGTNSSLGSYATVNQSTTSPSSAATNDLQSQLSQLTNHQDSPSPSPSLDHLHPSQTQPVASIPTPSLPDDDRPLPEGHIAIPRSSSGQPLISTTQASLTTISHTDLSRSPSETPLNNTVPQASGAPKLRGTSLARNSDAAGIHTPKRAGSAMSHTPGAETRKRSTISPWKGKEKASDDSGSPGESSANSSEDSNGIPNPGDEYADRVAKKERRAKAKQEAERRRPLLMSLSPASVNVLNLLASPARGTPSTSSAPRAFGDITSQLLSSDIPPQLDISPNPQVDPSTPARRVPTAITSPRRLDGCPLHFIQPNPVPLSDPNRTPARRVPLTSATQTPSRPLPLDDPNRTPARRVVVPISSPTKHSEATAAPDTRSLPFEESNVASDFVSSGKDIIQSLPPNGVERRKGNDIALASRDTMRLPFPIGEQPPESERLAAKFSVSSSLRVASSPLKPVPTPSLRQPSSTSASKIARVATKPCSRPALLQSHLPKLSSRLPVLGAGAGATTNVSLNRINPLSTAVPTRIPSPVKRHAAPMDISKPALAPSAGPGTSGAGPPAILTSGRKRQRMMTEDGDSDEPPAKRHMIAVRQVKKGMFNKTALTDPASSGPSTTHKEGSPVRPARPPGPIQFRQVIPGTLGHFETTRSSRDPSGNAEETHSAGAHWEDLDVPKSSSPLRDESPAMDTDTASTVTTLSREPTLEDIPASAHVLGPEPSFTTLSESGPELRRTRRVRKQCGPDTTMPSVYAPATHREPLSLTRTTSMVQRGTSSRCTTRTIKSPSIPMNSRQLHALTQANTVRNQVYIADLQRKIVHKHGPRPASPTTRVRTRREKAKEENAREREARAERRRRRGEGSAASINSDGDPIDAFNPSSSPPRAPVGETASKHARGPGDEEDYETPVREPKPSRLDPGKLSKNVKWDRGLARSISEFAAEQAAKRAKEGAAMESIRKGCLARDPGTLHLDPLGNVPDAYIPLDNLGREQVVVKRFIYDDDDIEASRIAKKKKL